MSRPSIISLANNPNLVPGIYNYCDRWCERCPLTSHCLVYASEEGDKESGESQDILNEQFWRRVNCILEETRQMIPEWANQAGIDLNQPEDDNHNRRNRQLLDNHPLAKAGKNYAAAGSDWFRELEQTINIDNSDSDSLHDARDVIQWYQYQIAVKTIRALSSRQDELKFETVSEELPKDSDGSAKVALLGIDRSIAGWRLMQLSLPESTESIVRLILQLERLRTRLETHFPGARAFIRPGFDETLGGAS